MSQVYFSKSMHSLDPMQSWDAETIFEKAYAGQAVPAGPDGQGTVLYDPWEQKNYNETKQLSGARYTIGKSLKTEMHKAALQKAGTSIDAGLTGGIGTGGAGTAGSALIPVWVDPNIVDRTIRETPLRNMLRRVAVRGKTVDFNVLTTKGGAHWRPEHGSLPEDIDTYDRVSVNIKFGYSVGELTGPARAAMRGYVDAEALDLSTKTAALFELEEDTIINGDSSTYSTEFDGLITQITTNTTNNSGAPITLSGIRTELATTYQANGQTNLVVTDITTFNFVKSLLMDFQRQPATPAQNLPFGIPGAFEFDGVPFIPSKFMPQTAASRRMLFLDTRYLFMGVLLDTTFEELATPTDSSKYMLKVYEAMVNQFEGAMSQVYGIQ